MSADLLIPLLMRWFHILSAIVATGGAIFSLFVFMPAAARVLQPTELASLRESMRKTWQHFIHTAILLLLISGFYNYLVITRHQHVDQALYHALFGVKFLLALVVFALALGLTSSRPWSQRMRANARTWQGALVLCAVVVVLISGVLRTMPKTNVTAAAPVAVTAPAP